MNIQLQKNKSNSYCFVTESIKKAHGKNRGAIIFSLEFVNFIPDDGDGENRTIATLHYSPMEFATWLQNDKEWRVINE